MRRLIPLTAAALLAGTLSVSASVAGAAPAPHQSRLDTTALHGALTKAGTKKHVKTGFAMSSSGFGTSVTGGAIPADSDTATGYKVMACNVYANKTKQNYVADANLGGMLKVRGVRSKLFTTKQGDTVSSIATHSVGKIILADSSLGTLTINALSTTATASHTASGYTNDADVSLGSIVLKPAIGPAVPLKLPKANRTLTVPGLAEISLGKISKVKNSAGAAATAEALVIHVIPSDTTVKVAHSYARIGGPIVKGVFHGYGAAIQASLLNGSAHVGRVPTQGLPCAGTDGKVRSKSLAGVNLGLFGTIGAATTAQSADQRAGHSVYGQESGKVADVSLLNGQIQVDAVQAVATVRRNAKGQLQTSSAGTEVGTVTVNGTAYDLSQVPTIEIPGLAKIESNVVTKVHAGLQVIGLKITLLDGSLLELDLGVARVQAERYPTD